MNISVIIPVYNKEEYVASCLENIILQDFGDFEVICVDDGSSDSSGAICDEWASKDSRIRVIHTANGGVTAARRKGVEMAKGTFIMFVDADDLLLPDAMQTLYQAAVQHKADEVIATYRTQQGVASPVVYEGLVEDVTPLIKDLVTGKNRFPILWAAIFKKSILENCLNTPRDIIEGEDKLMQMQVFMKSPKVFFIRDCVYLYNWGLPNSRRHTLALAESYDDALRQTLLPRWEEMEASYLLHQIKEYERFLLEKQFEVRALYYEKALQTLPNGIPLFHRMIWHLPPFIARFVVYLYKEYIRYKQQGL